MKHWMINIEPRFQGRKNESLNVRFKAKFSKWGLPYVGEVSTASILVTVIIFNLNIFSWKEFTVFTTSEKELLYK